MNDLNPEIPAWYSISQVGLTLLVLVALVSALVMVWRSQQLSALERIGWTLLSIAVPVLGPVIAILIVTRSRRKIEAHP